MPVGGLKRILFVDDEPRLLDGLKRTLYPLRKEWDMAFAASGQEALQLLAESEFDVIVTDFHMPHMSGVELLSEVVKRHPQVIRVVLSGTVDTEEIRPSVMLAHQYLDKPCDAASLRAAMECAFKLRGTLASPELRRLISRIHSLPSVPSVYTKLIEALQRADVAAKEIGEIIEQDLAMTAKILQLVNSAFFGVRRKVTNPTQAITYLGIDTVRSLVLSISVFSQFDPSRMAGFSIEALRNHGIAVGTLARDIARSLNLSKSDVEDAFLGGLLHELGKLILACNCPKEYQEAMHRAKHQRLQADEAELQVFGVTHAEVGAYLLSLWGLPDTVTEIVAHYRHPSPDQASQPLIAVHVADGLSRPGPDHDIDRDCLSAMGLLDQLPNWQRLHDEGPSVSLT